MKRLLAILLCISLLVGSVTVAMATETKGAPVIPKTNVTDDQGPTIVSFKFTENGKKLTVGDKLHLSMKLTDNTAVRGGYVYFNLYKDGRYVDSVYAFLGYDAESDLFTGEAELTQDLTAGTYVVSSIEAFDVYYNYTQIYTGSYDNKKLGKFTFKAPSVKAKVSIKENKKTVKPDTPIHITVTPKTASTEYNSAEVRFYNAEEYWSYTVSCYYNAETGNFETEMTFGWKDEDGKLHCNMPNGKWQVDRVTIYSKNNKGGTITIKDGPYVILKNSSKDKAMKISSAKIDKKGKKLTNGDKIHITAKVKDSDGIRRANAVLYYADNNWQYNPKTKLHTSEYHESYWIELKNASGTTWEGDFEFPDDMVNGKYYLEIQAEDKNGHSQYKEFPKQTITFNGADLGTSGMKNFVRRCYNNLLNKTPTDEEEAAMAAKLAERKYRAVDVIYELISSATGLSDQEKAERLVQTMKKSSEAAEIEKWAADLAGGISLQAVIDGIADSKEFRGLCNEYRINVGSLTKKTVTSITLNKKSLNLKVGKSETLKATIEPADALNKKLVWSSSDKTVAKVSSKGKVTAVGKGECVITCKSKDGGARVELKVTVK